MNKEKDLSIDLDNVEFAGFWIRFCALIIDIILLIVLMFTTLFSEILFTLFGMPQLIFEIFNAIISLGITFAYPILLTASNWQGTIGKKLCGLKVVDENGDKLTIFKSSLRCIGTFISAAVLFIGYIMAAFTDKKRALHDIIANTYVIKNK